MNQPSKTQRIGTGAILVALLLLSGVNSYAANGPDLAVSITDGLTTINPGATMLYTVTISNNGNVNATGVGVEANIPTNTYFVSSTDGGTVQNGHVVFPAFTLNVGATVTRQFILGLNSPLPPGASSTIRVRASAFADASCGADLNYDNNAASDCDTINGIPATITDLSIEITDGLTEISAGGTMLYTLTVSNLGNIDAHNVYVRALIPANATFVSAANGGYTDDGYVKYPLFSLPKQTTVTRQFTLQLNNPLPVPTPTQLCVCAHVCNDQQDANMNNNSATDCDTIKTGCTNDLLVGVTDWVACAIPGQNLTYTVTACNVSGTVATGVVVKATLPNGVTFVSASEGGTLSGNVVTWNVGTLNAGQTVTRTLIVKVNSPLAAGITSLPLVVTINDDGSHGVDCNVYNNTATDTDTICPPVDLNIEITDDIASCVTRGNNIVFTLKACNVGASVATGVIIKTTLPANTTYVSSSDSGSIAGGVITFPTIGTLNSGVCLTRFVTVRVNTPLPAGTTSVSSTATVTDDGSHGADATPANNTANDNVPVCPENPPGVDLTVAITDDIANCVVRGNNVVFTVTACNVGASVATGVVINATVPANSTYVSSTNSGSLANGVVTFPAITLNAGACVTRFFTVTVNNSLPAGTVSLSSTATVTDDGSHGAEATPANNTAVDNVPVCPLDLPGVDLTITVTDDADDCVKAKGTVVYTLTACNVGATNATGVVIRDSILAGTQYVSSSDGGTFAAGVVTFPTIAVLNAGQCVTRTVTVILPGTTPVASVSNTATVTDDGLNGAEATPANNTSTATVPVCPSPDLEITQDSSAVCFAPGAQITFTLLVKNNVLGNVSGVVVTDTIPANTSFIGASNGGTFASGVVTFPAFDLSANVTAIRTVTVMVDPALTASVNLSNLASVTDDGTYGADTNAANNSATRTDCVTFTPPCVAPSITSGPSAQPSPILAGQVETMTVGVSDNGSGRPITVTWDFGDGTPPATGTTVNHTYAAAGSYSILVTVSNACGAVGASLQAATGSQPNPFECTLLRAPINLKKTNSDSLTFVAQLPTKPGFNAAGKKIAFNFSNFNFSATLDKKGRYKDPRHNVVVKAFGTSSLVTLKVTKENLKSPLTPGVNASSQAATLPGQRYLISIGSDNFGQNIDVNYQGSSSKGMIFR